MLSCQNHAAAKDDFFSIYCMVNQIPFDYLKAYHQISWPRNGTDIDVTHFGYFSIRYTR